MSSTAYGAFDELLGRLTPLKGEVEAASKHRASVLEALRSGHPVVTFFQSGSWGNATSVRGFSDVDYFVWLEGDPPHQDPWKVLDTLEATLKKRYPDTGVWVDSPAVRVNFGSDGSERYEVVPAYLEAWTDDNVYTFKIPNPHGGWMLASPSGQRAITVREDERLNGRLRPLVRFLKLWKYANHVPISSYYLEVLATRCMANEGTIIYSWDLDAVFEVMYATDVGNIENLGTVSGPVSACAPWDRDEVMKAVLQATVLAGLARKKEQEKDEAAAFYFYNELFAGKFPART